MKKDSTMTGWKDFLQAEASSRINASDMAVVMESAKEWIDSHEDESAAAVEFLCKALEPGPVYASCLGVLHEIYGVPKPVSAWVRHFPGVFKYYAAKANPRQAGTAACALVRRMDDQGYWDRLRTSLYGVSPKVASEVGVSAWDELGIPDARNSWSRIRVEIFRAFLLWSGFVELTSATSVSQEFGRKIHMKIVDFFSGRRMKEVSLLPEGKELCDWKVTGTPPFLFVKPIGKTVIFGELDDSFRAELRWDDRVLSPEQVDFNGIAHRGNINIESVYVAYLEEIARSLSEGVVCQVSAGSSVTMNVIGSVPETGTVNFSAVVSQCFKKADGNCAVLFKTCLDDCGAPLPAMEGVLHDFGADFLGRIEVGDDVIGKYEERAGAIKIVSIESAKDDNILALEKVCNELLPATRGNLFFEQDTIERLIVPTLRYLGWNVDGVTSGQMVRGNRDNRSCHRPFDLNLFKELSSGSLSVGIECKDVAQEFPDPFGETSVSDADDSGMSSSNLPGIFQVVNDYLSDKSGIGNANSRVKHGYTAIVWTNWRTWVVVRNEFANVTSNPPVEDLPMNMIKPPGSYSDIHLQFRRFNLFDSNHVNASMLRALKSEIGEACFRNTPYLTEVDNTYQ